MTLKQAIYFYLDHFSHAWTQVKRLEKWNPKLTVRQNADNLKLKYDVARQLAKTFKLKYKPCYHKEPK